jgi:hypothetical protein
MGRLQRMKILENWQGSHLLVNLRIILHGARAQGIEPIIDTEIVLRKIGIVAHHRHLVAFRKLGFLLAAELCRQFAQLVSIHVTRQTVASTTLLGELENQISV